jgi:MoaA/NifB/PqqE/SkfB family radical SAM enzyme
MIPTANTDLLRATGLDFSRVQHALSWLRGEVNTAPRPVSVHMDLTLRCTGRCVHCKQWTWPPQKELEWFELERLFDVFRSWGVQTITFGGGNPLLHKDITYAIRSAHSVGLSVGVISEGFPLQDALIDTICKHTKWIRFSLDGPTASIHDKIRNHSGLYDSVVHCIQKLRNKNSDIIIGVNCVIQQLNIGHLSNMISACENIGVDILLFKLPHGDDINRKYLLNKPQWEWLTAWLGANIETPHQRTRTNAAELLTFISSYTTPANALQGTPVLDHYVKNSIKCYAPLFFLACNSFGDIYPCDYLQYDTRHWQQYMTLRDGFVLGNALASPDTVLSSLAHGIRHKLHQLPANGHRECGCCTRFCQLNSTLTQLARSDEAQNQAHTDAPLLPFL